jgi:hypothetical protein
MVFGPQAVARVEAASYYPRRLGPTLEHIPG